MLRPHRVPTRSPVTTLLLWVHTVEDDLQEIVSFSQSAAVWLCQQVQFDSKCFPLSNRLSIVLFTDGGSVTSERSTFWGLGRRTTDASDRFRSRAAGCYTTCTRRRTLSKPQRAGSTHACGCRVTEQNDRQRRRERERESPIWVKGKDDFKPRVHSLSIVSFWMVPAVDMGLRLTKIQDLFKTLSANRQIQDFFKVWKRLLKIHDLFKTLRPACEPCFLNYFLSSITLPRFWLHTTRVQIRQCRILMWKSTLRCATCKLFQTKYNLTFAIGPRTDVVFTLITIVVQLRLKLEKGEENKEQARAWKQIKEREEGGEKEENRQRNMMLNPIKPEYLLLA